MFAGVKQPLSVARYHSLVGTTIPAELQVVAHYNEMCMAIYHETDKVIGFQFHPESILTCEGAKILQSSLNLLLDQK